MLNAERILLLISSTLFLSYLSGIIYNRTRIPDLVWLLLFGIVLGPILNLFNAQIFINIFDLMILVTVALFAFSTGLSFNIQQILENSTRAFSMALGSFLAVSLSVGLVLNYLLPSSFSLVPGILLGAMLGGIDGVSISSLVNSLGKESKRLGEAGPFLQLESTLSDPIKVVGVLTLIKMVLLTNVGPRTAARDILFTLIVSVLIGVSSGIIWGEVITRLRDRPLNYMMTIAALFPIYLLADYLSDGGGGPIAVFLFGAVLMNYGYVTKRLGMNRRARIDRRLIREYHDEITFLIKAMFFVYLGLLVQFNLDFIAISLLITVLIVAVRYIVASLLGYVQGIPAGQVAYTRLFFIQGAGSLVLTQFVAKYDPTGFQLANPTAFTSIVIPVVILSIVFSSIIAPMVASKQVEVKPPETPVEPEKEQAKPEKVENKNSKKDEKKS